MSNSLYWYLFFLLCTPALLFVIHIVVVRLTRVRSRRTSVSNQKILVVVSLLLNIPVMIGGALIISISEPVRFTGILYGIVVYNSMAYMYFHFFNMSETARRVKLLVGVYKGNLRTKQQVSQYYSTDESVKIRLIRMQQLSQIEHTDEERYVLKRKLLYFVSFIVFFWRSVLGLKQRSNGQV